MSLLPAGLGKDEIIGAFAAMMGAVQEKIAEGDGTLFEQLQRVVEKAAKTVESSELYELVAPDIGRVVERIGERVDAIR